MIDGSTRVFALLGSPVRQSLSPSMHNTLFQRRGINAVYVALEVDPAAAGGVAAAIRTLGLAGVNLTVPFKERVLPDLDQLTQGARASGAVNVVVREGSRLIGYNTDGEGYIGALREELRAGVEGADMGVLGAGGTGRAVAAAAAAAGARRITLYNRTVERAERAVEALHAHFPLVAFEARPLSAEAFNQPHDRVVNCTSVAAGPQIERLPLTEIPPRSIWTDANYYQSEPPRFAACVARSIRIQRGIGMLMHQGARAFACFTGVEVEVEAIRGVLDIGGW